MARFAQLGDWLGWLEGLHPKAIDLGLARIGEVWRTLGAPPLATRVISVAGTNGKGSSVAMLDAILRAAGRRVGRFTSPHFLRFNERIAIDGTDVDDATLCDAFARIDAARGTTTLSYFEFTALAAFLCFADAHRGAAGRDGGGLDVAILEVGLGGRLDAVNLIDADVALITAIDLDHQDWLGDDREQIGHEKAGILRPGCLAVCSDPNPPRSIAAHATTLPARLAQLGVDFTYRAEGDAWSWASRERRLHALPWPALPGPFQLDNAAGVLAVLCLGGVGVGHDAIAAGLRAVHWPGRWQEIPGDVPLILDVAHNPHAARGLAQTLAQHPAARTLAVWGMLSTKDVAGVIAALRDRIDAWFPATLPGPLGLPAARLTASLRAAGVAEAAVNCDNVATALQAARRAARPGDRILVFGSFLTVEAAMRVLDAAAGTPT